MSTHITLRYTGFDADSINTGYPLGNGYRVYLPPLMRFAAPDESSPFERGGVNPYAYCGANPISRSDPSGRFFLPVALAAGAVAAISLKAAGSMLARKFRGPVGAWIDELNEVPASGTPLSSADPAIESAHAAWFRGQPEDGIRNGDSARVSAIRMQRAGHTEAEAIEQIEKAKTALAVARKHWDSARLLRLAADSSSEPEIVLQLASDEDAAARNHWHATASLIERLGRMRKRLSFELTVRFDSVQAEYEAQQFDFYSVPNAAGASDQRNATQIITRL